MHASVLAFGRRVIAPEHACELSVLEVGSRDVNGSLRQHVESLGPACYVGVDAEAGTGVDHVADAEAGGLVEDVGGPFDLVVCTEVLEHVRDWRAAVTNLKECVRPGGRLLVTTRSFGFGYHGYPGDHWRYELPDVERIFFDFVIETLERDAEIPGVFLYARCPESRLAASPDLSSVSLYSMDTLGRETLK